MRFIRRDSRDYPRNLLAVAFALMVLSFGAAVWRWARGEPVGPYELSAFTAALIVVGVDLYLLQKIKEQFGRAIAGILEPGEQVQAGTLTRSGRSIYAILPGAPSYFVAVTDRRVFFMRASSWTLRPKKLAWVDPLGAGQLSEVKPIGVLSGHFKYLRPGELKPIRFNVHRWWGRGGRGDDFQQVLAAMQVPPPPP